MRPAKCASWVLDINALPLVPDQQVLIGRERLNPLSEVPNKVFRSTSRGLAGDCLHETEHVLGAMIDLAHPANWLRKRRAAAIVQFRHSRL